MKSYALHQRSKEEHETSMSMSSVSHSAASSARFGIESVVLAQSQFMLIVQSGETVAIETPRFGQDDLAATHMEDS